MTTKTTAADKLQEVREALIGLLSYNTDDTITRAEKALATLDQLRDKLDASEKHAQSLLALLIDIRYALGDNGKRMQDELVEYARHIAALADREAKDAARWRTVETLMILGYVEMIHADDGGYGIALDPAESIAPQRWDGNSPEEAIDAACAAMTANKESSDD